MTQKPATIKEIAKRLNVSVSTVSRALHNHPSIGLRTKMQVQKLAEELNYEPNQAAISFKQGKTFTIGVILPNLGEEFFSTAINGIENIATENNYTVLIGQSHDDVEREKKIVDTMRRHRVDGLLVSLSKNTDSYEHFEQLANYSIPVVFFDRVPDSPDVYSVSCNLKSSSVQLVDWLVSQGHKNIGFIKGPDTMLPSQERLNGYLEGLKKNNLSVDQSYIVQTDLSKEKTLEAVRQLLLLEKRPAAVIAFNDYVALDAIKYSRSEGLKVNKDIYFVSYANLPMTSYLDEPPLASVEQFPYEQAEKATEILMQLINKKNPEEIGEKRVVMQSKVVVHEDLVKKIEKKNLQKQ
ncbi:LacI family DNA-binding transcriptional regulator [Terrimonas pollutisoli]|uniref:LacI family DNA-binding transcriptional regulator n=1 Tax=Terrimonas pollutisoli TaxID=3034147 RepID=UPI0023EADC39|nr:LacI family DNA-binding transcriptional regulator [Terrimonas sp. H1YJ31]